MEIDRRICYNKNVYKMSIMDKWKIRNKIFPFEASFPTKSTLKDLQI